MKRNRLFLFTVLLAGLLMGVSVVQAQDNENAKQEAEQDAYLGIRPGPLSKHLRKVLGLKTKSGVVVQQIVSGSPADKGGLKKFDILLKADDTELESIADLRDALSTKSPGDTVAFRLIRSGDEKTVRVTLGSRGNDGEKSGPKDEPQSAESSEQEEEKSDDTQEKSEEDSDEKEEELKEKMKDYLKRMNRKDSEEDESSDEDQEEEESEEEQAEEERRVNPKELRKRMKEFLKNHRFREKKEGSDGDRPSYGPEKFNRPFRNLQEQLKSLREMFKEDFPEMPSFENSEKFNEFMEEWKEWSTEQNKKLQEMMEEAKQYFDRLSRRLKNLTPPPVPEGENSGEFQKLMEEFWKKFQDRLPEDEKNMFRNLMKEYGQDLEQEKKDGDVPEKDHARKQSSEEQEQSGTPYLGVRPGRGGMWDSGVKVNQVVPNGPAAEAGLKSGDIIVGLNGKEVSGRQSLVEILQTLSPGEKVKVRVKRGDKKKTLTVTLGNRADYSNGGGGRGKQPRSEKESDEPEDNEQDQAEGSDEKQKEDETAKQEDGEEEDEESLTRRERIIKQLKQRLKKRIPGNREVPDRLLQRLIRRLEKRGVLPPENDEKNEESDESKTEEEQAGEQEKDSSGESNQSSDPSSSKNTHGKKFAGMKLKEVGSDTYHRFSDFQGKVIILDVWRTWCGPCRMEIPHFKKLYQKYKDRGLVVIGTSDEAEEKVQRFADAREIPYLLLMEQKGNLPEVIEQVKAFPTTFIIGRDGTVKHVVRGYHPKSYFEKRVKKLLGDSGSNTGARENSSKNGQEGAKKQEANESGTSEQDEDEAEEGSDNGDEEEEESLSRRERILKQIKKQLREKLPGNRKKIPERLLKRVKKQLKQRGVLPEENEDESGEPGNKEEKHQNSGQENNAPDNGREQSTSSEHQPYAGFVPSPDPTGEGILVESVVDGSPAASAGLKAGDVILELDGNRVKSMKSARNVYMQKKPGQTLTLLVKRGDAQKEIQIDLVSKKAFENRKSKSDSRDQSSKEQESGSDQARSGDEKNEKQNATAGPSPFDRVVQMAKFIKQSNPDKKLYLGLVDNDDNILFRYQIDPVEVAGFLKTYVEPMYLEAKQNGKMKLKTVLKTLKKFIKNQFQDSDKKNALLGSGAGKVPGSEKKIKKFFMPAESDENVDENSSSRTAGTPGWSHNPFANGDDENGDDDRREFRERKNRWKRWMRKRRNHRWKKQKEERRRFRGHGRDHGRKRWRKNDRGDRRGMGRGKHCPGCPMKKRKKDDHWQGERDDHFLPPGLKKKMKRMREKLQKFREHHPGNRGRGRGRDFLPPGLKKKFKRMKKELHKFRGKRGGPDFRKGKEGWKRKELRKKHFREHRKLRKGARKLKKGGKRLKKWIKRQEKLNQKVKKHLRQLHQRMERMKRAMRRGKKQFRRLRHRLKERSGDGDRSWKKKEEEREWREKRRERRFERRRRSPERQLEKEKNEERWEEQSEEREEDGRREWKRWKELLKKRLREFREQNEEEMEEREEREERDRDRAKMMERLKEMLKEFRERRKD